MKNWFKTIALVISLIISTGLGSAFAAAPVSQAVAQSHVVAYTPLGTCGGAASTFC